MIKTYPFKALGNANHGWLNAHYHFSFSSYHNPARMGFGNLRVINDDEIKAGQGFPPHSHHDMEIITYVRDGAIMHKDSLGNDGITNAGDVQVMSAGTGIQHSEFSHKTADTMLYQIWILPNKEGVKPRWETKGFPKEFSDKLSLLVSGREQDKSALFIYADAAIYGGRLKKGVTTELAVGDKAYILASKGSVEVNGTVLNTRDGAEVVNEKSLNIKAIDDSEVLVIDVGN